MKEVTVKRVNGATIEVEEVIPADVFDQARERALGEMQKTLELKGFRKGHVPVQMVESSVGEEKILERAASIALGNSWSEIMKTHRIEVIGRPKFQILKIAKGNPLHWKATVSVLPEISLPDIRKIAKETRHKEQRTIQVEEKELQDTLEWLRKARANGATPPELNDAFAMSVGPFPTLEALRAHLRSGILIEKEGRERERIRLAILDRIYKESQFDVPSALIEAESDRMLTDLRHMVTHMGKSWESYLEETQKTETSIRKETHEDAERRAAYGLILRQIAHNERITVSPEEIKKRAEEMRDAHQERDGKAPDLDQVMGHAEGVLMNEEVFAILESND